MIKVSIALLTVLTSLAYAEDFDEKAVCKRERRTLDEATRNASYNQRSADALTPKIATARAQIAAARTATEREGMTAYVDMLIGQQRQFLADHDVTSAQAAAAQTATAACLTSERTAYDAAQQRETEIVRAAAESAHAAELHEHDIMMNHTFTRTAYSVLVCIDDASRHDALDEIAQEKKYAQLGGVQSNAKLYELQTQIRQIDLDKARHLQELKQLIKQPAIGCQDAIVKAVATCVLTRDESDAVDPPCIEGKLAGPVEATLIIARIEGVAVPRTDSRP